MSYALTFDPERLELLKLAYAMKRLEILEDAERVEASFIDFVEAAWPSIDSAEYQPSWAIEGLCEHLQAVTEGQILRLLINFPPRSGKTLVSSVCWPAWVWARAARSFWSGPGVKFLCGSYSDKLTLQNSNMCRRLIQSPWYQARWGKRFNLRLDQNTKTQFDTSEGGSRIATSVGGTLLGIGGDIVCVDDGHNVTDVESDAERETSLNWFTELRSTRLNDPKQSAIMVVMQRLHEEDITGRILSGEDAAEWTHFMIPMRYDWGRHCVTGLGWNDPRGCDDAGDPLVVPIDEDPFRIPRDVPAAVELNEVRQGELMWPERFGEREVRALERELGPYRASGRLQQQPTPDKGGIFQRDWWQLWQPANVKYPEFTYVVASVDTAFTKLEENDPSALTIYGVWQLKGSPRIMLIHAWRKFLQMHGPLPLIEYPLAHDQMSRDDLRKAVLAKRAKYMKLCREKVPQLRGETDSVYYERLKEYWGLVEWVADTCRRFGVHKLLIEGKASGLTAADELRRIHGREGWSIQVEPVHGDKRARALAVQPVWSQGMVYAPDRDWAELVIDEMVNFPKGARDDLTDSSTQAVKHLRDVGFAPRPEEAAAEEADRSRYRKKREPLYPGMRG